MILDNVPLNARGRRFIKRLLTQFVDFLNQRSSFTWKVTSYLRDSPNHRYGWALDVAPDLPPPTHHDGSRKDPELNKRVGLLLKLVQIKDAFNHRLKNGAVSVFVESDHLHIQPVLGTDRAMVVAWPYQHRAYPNGRDLIKYEDWRM